MNDKMSNCYRSNYSDKVSIEYASVGGKNKYNFFYVWKDGQSYPVKYIEDGKEVDLYVAMTPEEMTNYFLKLINDEESECDDDVIGIHVSLEYDEERECDDHPENILEHYWGKVKR
tara:strand:+ start:374 stop:721 length:348 start_codon:yes stop_codon:yes gene_type:complete